MYCSVCKLRVADDSVVNCPICQALLQSDTDEQEVLEPLELTEEIHASEGDKAGLKTTSEIFLDDESGLDFDPEALGLKSEAERGPEEDVGDIRVLADLWAQEDLEADLDGILTEAFIPEENGLKAENTVYPELDKVTQTNAAVPLGGSSGSWNLWLPLLVVLGIIVAIGGGWFYLHNAGVQTEVAVVEKDQSADMVDSQAVNADDDEAVTVEMEAQKVVGSDVAPGVVEAENLESAVAEPDVESQLHTDMTTAEVPATSVPSVADTAAASQPEPEMPEEPAVIPPVAPEAAAAPQPEPETVSEPVPDSVVPAAEEISQPDKIAALTVASPTKKTAPLPAQVTGRPHYVVQIGSFRSVEGAARQMARLEKKGFTAFKVEADLGEKGVWQRVIVPGGLLKSDAELVQERLKQLLPREDSLIRKVFK
jgi:cell division protein FtsN